MPVSTVQYDEVYKIYQRVDLMRAKYRHADLTLKGWCFHGNQIQGWAGGACSGGRLIPVTVDRGIALLSPAGLNINPATHPWLSLHVDVSIQRDASTYASISTMTATTLEGWMARAGYKIFSKANDEITINGIRLSRKASETLTYTQFTLVENQFMDEAGKKPVNVRVDLIGAETDSSAAVLSLCPATSNRSMMGDIRPATDNNPVNGVGIYLTPPSWWPLYWKLIGAVEYIKFDIKNVFAPMTDEELAITTDFNVLRQEVEVFNKASVSWENPTPVSAGSRVKQYVDIIKRSDIDQANRVLTNAAPYNGCGTCDTFSCSCNRATHGGVACSTCNGCNAYSACSCNVTTHGYSSSCTCNGNCDGYSSSCACNGSCHGYQAACAVPDGGYDCFCYGQDGAATSCTVQYGGTYSSCSACDTTSNAWCKATNAACGAVHDDAHCTCNKGAYRSSGTCSVSCYSGYVAGKSCAGCDWQMAMCFQHSKAATCSCQGSYSTSTCSCQASHGYTSSCSCNGQCHGYQGCSQCNSCNGYVKCSCDMTCNGQSCAQCNSTGYSAMT